MSYFQDESNDMLVGESKVAHKQSENFKYQTVWSRIVGIEYLAAHDFWSNMEKFSFYPKLHADNYFYDHDQAGVNISCC